MIKVTENKEEFLNSKGDHFRGQSDFLKEIVKNIKSRRLRESKENRLL